MLPCDRDCTDGVGSEQLRWSDSLDVLHINMGTVCQEKFHNLQL